MSPDPSTISIRLALAEDEHAITNTINAAFLIERFFIDGNRIDANEVRALMDLGTFLVAEINRVVVGCVYVEPRGERGYLGLLSVDPSYQKTGVGRRLMEAAEDHARSAGCQFMDLRTVNLRTELPPYYRRLGYKETGTEPFPEDVPTRVPCHFIVMSRALG